MFSAFGLLATALLLKAPTDKGWHRPALPIALATEVELTADHPIDPDRGPVQEYRYHALWDLDLGISIATNDLLGLFLEILDENGNPLVSDEESEAGPSCAVKLALSEDQVVQVRLGTTSPDEHGSIELCATETPDIEHWRGTGRAPPSIELSPEDQVRLASIQERILAWNALYDAGEYQAAKHECRELDRLLGEFPNGDLQRSVTIAAHRVASFFTLLAIPELARFSAEMAFRGARLHGRPDAPLVVDATMRWGSIQALQGRHEEGLRRAARAVVLEERRGGDLLDLTQRRYDLAALLSHLRHYAEARPLFELVLERIEELWPANALQPATIWIGFAQMLLSQGDALGAVQVLDVRLDPWSQSLGPNHPVVQRGWSVHAAALSASGDRPRARSSVERALEIAESNGLEGTLSASYDAQILSNLLASQGDWDAAILCKERVVATRRGILGENAGSSWNAVLELAELSFAAGRADRARVLLAPFDRHERNSTSVEPEIERLYGDRARAILAESSFREGDFATAAALLTELASSERAPGLEQPFAREIAQYRALCELALDPESALRSTENCWERQIDWLMGLPHDLPTLERILVESEVQRARFLTLFERSPQRQLQVILVHRCLPSARWRRRAADDQSPPDPQQIARALGETARGLSITRTQGVHPYRAHYGVWYYLALVLQPNGSVQSIDLGDAHELDALVQNWRNALLARRADEFAAGEELSRRLWVPELDAALAGSDRLIVAADAGLATIAWAALPLPRAAGPGGSGTERSRLGDRCALSAVDTLAVLPLLRGEPPSKSAGLLAVGGLDYDQRHTPSSSVATASPSALALSTPRSGAANLHPLPRSGTEARAVVHSFRASGTNGPAVLLEGRDGTKEELVARAPGMAYLHLATHGWYVSEQLVSVLDASVMQPRRSQFLSEYESVRGLSPGQLCGLAFAGANQAPAKRYGLHPGILLAAEIPGSLDLSACRLAVLSACESTLGPVRLGQNLTTLNRAFWNAGADTVIGSLWQVDDRASEALFRDFYHRLWHGGATVHEALRQAQQSLQNHPDHPEWAHPYFWAPWVLHGRTEGL